MAITLAGNSTMQYNNESSSGKQNTSRKANVEVLQEINITKRHLSPSQEMMRRTAGSLKAMCYRKGISPPSQEKRIREL
ncbi:hypothetical protein Cni_G14991 [Canna indica]|uniref:Uncharacterized protein n=1 Tax=Canna indica TaxID=4628 RepID=A0AAQ3KDR8_9LILI|nr:hypothetical protein Cni_G14991 [Canna indica]